MTGIAGILGSNEEYVSSNLDLMLATMETRGTIIAKSIVKGKDAVAAIGSCSHSGKELGALRPQETSVVIDGTLPEDLDLDLVGGQVDRQSISDSMRSSEPFSCVAIIEGKLLAGRDVIGQKPLYFGRNPEGVTAFASLKTALTRIHASPITVQPGRLTEAKRNEVSVVMDKSLDRPGEIATSEEEASATLRDMLVASLDSTGSPDLALAFSGGLDSSLVAQAAKENGLRPELITVGMKGQQEIKHATAMARFLGFDITVKELTQSDVMSALPTVIRTVESVDPVLVGVSVPLFFACEIAEKMGLECLLAGQLSDELFAGYGRFEDLARRRDFHGARDEVWKSVLAAPANDFEPGDKLAVSHHLELQCPFAFLPLVEYALTLPIRLKLKTLAGRVVRKYILRRVAKDWSLPEEIANRPKKAVQYSSGVQRILLKEAKRRGVTLTSFLESLD